MFHNRYLRKINLSSNQFEEGTKELCELLKINKTLSEIRLRFCGLKSSQMAEIFKSLHDNQIVSLMDVSENQMG